MMRAAWLTIDIKWKNSLCNDQEIFKITVDCPVCWFFGIHRILTQTFVIISFFFQLVFYFDKILRYPFDFHGWWLNKFRTSEINFMSCSVYNISFNFILPICVYLKCTSNECYFHHLKTVDTTKITTQLTVV